MRVCGAIRSRAARMSASVGVVVVVAIGDVEDGAKDCTDSAQRVEFSALDRVEEPPQLGISDHGALEMPPRPSRRDSENLGREMLPATLLEQSPGLEVGTWRLDLLPA